MGTDNLTTIRAAVRAELADTGTDFTNAIIDQAVAEVVSDISRLAPRQLVHVEVLHSRTVTREAYVTNHDAWVNLSNKPVDPQSTFLLAADPVAAILTTATPVGYWPLNELSGQALDASANSNHGTVSGATQGAAGLITNDTDTSYDFDGIDDQITISDNAAIQNIWGGGGTVSGWINVDSGGANDQGRVLEKGSWHIKVQNESDGYVKLSFFLLWSGNSADYKTASAVIPINSTVHIAIVYDSDSALNKPSFYIDGTLYTVANGGLEELGAPTGTATTDVGGDLIIGSSAPAVSPSGEFDGSIQKLVIYNTALTTNQVRSLGYKTYIENTDYIVDYAQGRVQVLSTGSIPDSVSLDVSYEKSLHGIDVSSLTDLIIIERVERMPYRGRSYQTYESWYRWGDIVWLESRDGQTQENWIENDTVRLWYSGEHTKPTAGAAGSYPAYLDDLVVKGAVAYSLFSKHRERQLQAITYNANAATQNALADDDIAVNIAAVQTAILGALNDANTVLDLINTLAEEPIAKALTALDNLSSAVANLDSLATANQPPADMQTALDAIITQLGTEAEALMDAAAVTGIDASVEAALDAATAIFGGTVVTALDKVADHMETDATNPDSAENQLAAGDSLINAINVGDQASLVYARYAEAQIAISNGFVSEARNRIEQGLGYVQEARERIAQKQVNLAEVRMRIDIARGYFEEAQGRKMIGDMINDAASNFFREAEGRVAVANALVNVAVGYISEAQQRSLSIEQYARTADIYISQTQNYMELANHEIQISERLLLDARERHTDYWEHLTSRTEIARQERLQSTRQLPQNR